MFISEKELDNYTCNLQRKFLEDFKTECYDPIGLYYDTNELLEYLFDYSEINDKSKQYFLFMCIRTYNDVPTSILKKYYNKFGLKNCGTEIYNSFGCEHSNLLINCNGMESSFGCNKCKFCNHMLYCTNQRHKSYMAFNKEVTKKRFAELIRMSPEQLSKEPEYNVGVYTQVNSLLEYIYRPKSNDKNN